MGYSATATGARHEQIVDCTQAGLVRSHLTAKAGSKLAAARQQENPANESGRKSIWNFQEDEDGGELNFSRAV